MADEQNAKPRDATAAQGDKDPRVGRLAHRMNNAVAYVLTNLNLLAEELEAQGLTEPQRRMLQLVVEATSGADRVGELIRELKVLEWGTEKGVDDSGDDTWDEDKKPRRILVIDDEPYILASIRRALRHYDVTLTEGGQRAIDALAADHDYDLVLCDLVMAHVNGIDVHRWIKQHRPELLERLIFMTAGAFTVEVRDFLAHVSSPVMHKPFDTKTLRWMIAQSLRRRMAEHPPQTQPKA
jgi:CheY-like chemotaxis protein